MNYPYKQNIFYYFRLITRCKFFIFKETNLNIIFRFDYLLSRYKYFFKLSVNVIENLMKKTPIQKL